MEENEEGLVPIDPRAEIVSASGVDMLLSTIRNEWQAKHLIERVKKLLPVDPSSACQRLLNASIHDLRQKIVIAGLDIAREVADRFNLPSVAKVEDITENYSVSRIIDLAYRMGILNRPDWRRIKRCYEIRRDLEHEDDEYVAEIEDIVYIFKSCIQIVLSRDPVEIIKVDDINELIDSPTALALNSEIIEEFEKAPDSRQKEILEHLINTSLNPKKADIVRQNSMEIIRHFQSLIKNNVKVEVGQFLQDKAGKKPLSLAIAKVAYAAGILPYLKQRKVLDFFNEFYKKFSDVGYQWRHFASHRNLLDEFEDVGGLLYCPEEPRRNIVLWMVLCFIGEPGGYGEYGRHRSVFFSDVASMRIKLLFKRVGKLVKEDLENTKSDLRVNASLLNSAIARRFEILNDIVNEIET